MNPCLDQIALSNEGYIAVYDVVNGEHLATLPLTGIGKCEFWTWLDANTIGVVNETDVLHWDVNSQATRTDKNNGKKKPTDTPRHVFRRDERMKNNCQITSYKCDILSANWFVLTGLNVDEEGEQNFSHQSIY